MRAAATHTPTAERTDIVVESRIGTILCEMDVLTDADVRAILDVQCHTGQKFGTIAMRLGLATPEQIWEAWARQLATTPREVDLDELGTDSDALACVGCEAIVRHRVWPLRRWGNNLVIATGSATSARAVSLLTQQLELNVYRCVAPDEQLERYITTFAAEASNANDEAFETASVG